MPDGVHPAMNAVQTLRLHPAGQGLSMNAESLELVDCNNTVLVRGEPGNRRILVVVGEFLTHVRE